MKTLQNEGFEIVKTIESEEFNTVYFLLRLAKKNGHRSSNDKEEITSSGKT